MENTRALSPDDLGAKLDRADEVAAQQLSRRYEIVDERLDRNAGGQEWFLAVEHDQFPGSNPVASWRDDDVVQIAVHPERIDDGRIIPRRLKHDHQPSLVRRDQTLHHILSSVSGDGRNHSPAPDSRNPYPVPSRFVL